MWSVIKLGEKLMWDNLLYLSSAKGCLYLLMFAMQWQPTLAFLPGESQGWGSLVGCHLWGYTQLDKTEAT